MTPRLARVPALLLAALALSILGAVGCGDDNDDVTLPTISVEDETTTTAPDTTTTETTETEPQTGGTGTGSGDSGSGSVDPGKEDSATNDKPPEPGSPEEAFEQACKENPAACG